MLRVRSRRALARKWHRQREEEEDAADRAEEAAERRELPGPPAGAPPFPAPAQPESLSAYGGMHRVLEVCKQTGGGESRASSCPGRLQVCRLTLAIYYNQLYSVNMQLCWLDARASYKTYRPDPIALCGSEKKKSSTARTACTCF